MKKDIKISVNSKNLYTRDNCPICKSNDFKMIFKEPYNSKGIENYLTQHYNGKSGKVNFDGFYFEIVTCLHCHLSFQLNVPTQELLVEIYDNWITEEDEHLKHFKDYRYIADQIQFVIHHFNLSPSKLHILDFGFGWAEWAKMAMAFGCNVSGSELSEERKNYGKSIGIKILDLENLEEDSFHFINTEQVFEHLVSPKELLEKLKFSLKKGGILKISVPNSSSSLKKIKRKIGFQQLSKKEIMPIAPLEHLNSFTYTSLVSLGASLGLKPLTPSFFKILNSSAGWLEPVNAIKTLTRPFYRHVYPKSTYVYFVKN